MSSHADGQRPASRLDARFERYAQGTMGRPAFLYRLMMRFYKPFQLFERLRPFGGRSDDETSSSHIIPVNRSISPRGSVILPMKVIAAFIERTDTVAVLDECLCRRGEGCSSFPIETGCLLLGPAARDLHGGLGRIVGADEALEHAERAIRMGLTPLVVHNRFDAWLWGIEYRRMMNICFCCDCCCSVRRAVRLGIDAGATSTMHRLDGLTVSIDGRCDGCGLCAAACFAGAIRIHGDCALIDPACCKGCGGCAAVCPRTAITMELAPGLDTPARLLAHYGRRSDVGIMDTPPHKRTEKTP